jgi:hypothetical protein
LALTAGILKIFFLENRTNNLKILFQKMFDAHALNVILSVPASEVWHLALVLRAHGACGRNSP